MAELVKKAQQLEVELDKTKEELLTTTQKLEEKEKALLASELEVYFGQLVIVLVVGIDEL